MLTTIEAEIDVNGQVTFLEPLKITKKSRAIVTILDDETSKTNDARRKEAFGWWQGREITREEYLQLDHNERIDFDLAKSYADDQEDEK